MDNIGGADLSDQYETLASSMEMGIFLDVAVASVAFFYLAREGWQARRAQSLQAHFGDLWNVLDAATHLGQLLTVVLHVAHCDEARIAGACTMLLLSAGVLFYLRGFEHTSFLVAIW